MNFISRGIEYIIKIFKWIFFDFKNFFLVLFGILALVFIFKFNHLNNKYENELINVLDTTSVYKNKVGELYHLNQSYITSEKELKSKNEELYNEIKKLKDNPIVVSKTEFMYKIDTIHAKSDTVYMYVNQVTNEQIAKSNFSYNDNWIKINGSTTFNCNSYKFNTDINSIEMDADISTNFIERDNKLYVITKSSNPYIQINNSTGVIVSPENSKILKNKFDKRWGVMVGVGPSFVLDNNKVKLLPAMQVTLGYKLFSF